MSDALAPNHAKRLGVSGLWAGNRLNRCRFRYKFSHAGKPAGVLAPDLLQSPPIGDSARLQHKYDRDEKDQHEDKVARPSDKFDQVDVQEGDDRKPRKGHPGRRPS